MTKMVIEVLGKDMFGFCDVCVPHFVVDVYKFKDEVQKTIDYYTVKKLEKALENIKADSDMEEEEREGKEKEVNGLINYLKNSGRGNVCGDSASVYYAVAFKLISGSLGVAGFNDLYNQVTEYGERYIGSEEWTDDRKRMFSAIKNGCNRIMTEKLNLTVIDAGRDIYKSFTPEFSSKAIDMFIYSVFGRDEVGTTGKKDNKVIGIKRRQVKKEQAFVLLLRSLMKKYGCDIETRKSGKLADIIL